MVSGLSGGLQPDGHASPERAPRLPGRMAIGRRRPLTMPPFAYPRRVPYTPCGATPCGCMELPLPAAYHGRIAGPARLVPWSTFWSVCVEPLQRFIDTAAAMARAWLGGPNGEGMEVARPIEAESEALNVNHGVGPALLLFHDDPSVHAEAGLPADTLGSLAAVDPSSATLADASGQHRAPWFWLVLHLHLAAAAVVSRHGKSVNGVEAVAARIHGWVDRLKEAPEAGRRSGAGLWAALCGVEAAAVVGNEALAARAHDLAGRCLDAPGEAGALHRQQPEESLDGWIFAELVALHALGDLAAWAREMKHNAQNEYMDRLRRAAGYHLENTQPDNVTTQPWGALAFALDPAAWLLAEQQLHDVSVQAGLEAGGRTVAALLLADAVHFGRRHLAC